MSAPGQADAQGAHAAPAAGGAASAQPAGADARQAPRPFPGEEEGYVPGLLRDARLVADYGLRAGLFGDGALFDAIAAVEKTKSDAPTAPVVVALQKAMNKAMTVVPFSTLLELRQGWRPGLAENTRGRLIVLLAMSLVLMAMIAGFSQVYNRGVVLLTDIKAAAVSDPNQRYDDLVRQLVDARKEMAKEAASAQGADELKLKAYFQAFNDLRSLDRSLTALGMRYQQVRDETDNPFFGSGFLAYAYYRLQERLGIAGADARLFLQNVRNQSLANVEAPPQGGQGEKGTVPDLISANCPTLKARDLYIDAQLDYVKQRMDTTGKFSDVVRDFVYETSYLNCFEKLDSNRSYANFDDWMRDINNRLAPYNLWLMPSLFGAMGAVIFYLRLIANPLEPNPSNFKVVHRIAFGALAGMALAWFWVPEVRFGIDLPNVGFGLFAMAFIVGFSLDVFFTMLDRFVALANTAVGNIGTNRPA